MTNDVKDDTEGAIVRTTEKGEVGEETINDTSLIQKMSTEPATPDDIETTMTGVSVETGRDHGTIRDENVVTARDHPDTNDAENQKAAPARHLRGKLAAHSHLKTNPTGATQASKNTPTQPAVHHRPSRNPTTNPQASWPKKPTPSPAPPKS